MLDTAKSQIVGVRKTVDTMIEEQAEKCKQAGTELLYVADGKRRRCRRTASSTWGNWTRLWRTTSE